MGQILKKGEPYELGLFLGQRGHRRPDFFPPLPGLDQIVGRRRFGRRQSGILRIKLRLVGAPEHVDATVPRDREHPGADARLRGIESVRAAPERQHDVLGQIFSEGRLRPLLNQVAFDPRRKVVEQSHERVTVAVLRNGHHRRIPFIQPRGRRSRHGRAAGRAGADVREIEIRFEHVSLTPESRRRITIFVGFSRGERLCIFAGMKKTLAIILTLLLIPIAASAQSGPPEEVAAHGAWRVFTHGAGDNKTCFMASPPERSRGAEGRRRGPVSLYVSNRPGAGAKDEVSVAIGYPFRKDAAAIEIGGRTYRMFTEGETAWSDGQDSELVAAMRAKLTATVSATSRAGTDTVDTFSLRGFTRAHQALSQACPVS